MSYGFDVGTYNLVCCTRDEQGNFSNKREVNAFLELPLENRFVFNMMKNAGVPLIERENIAYALGESAVNMAYTMSQLELKRPMAYGCVNPKEKDAFQILSIMIHSLLGEIKQDNETLYYCVPANAIDEETDADYHTKVLGAIFNAYTSEKGYKVNANPINEALALVYAELAKKSYTGIGISCGAGLVNICYAIYGQPVFTFAIVNSGDWIDRQAAKATGETTTFINKEKNKIDLSKQPTNLVERAIQTQYKIMIEHTISGIKKGLANATKAIHSDKPVDIVIAGGTASPNGFVNLFKNTLMQEKLPINVGEIIKPNDPLYSVARGCLIAAEAAR